MQHQNFDLVVAAEVGLGRSAIRPVVWPKVGLYCPLLLLALPVANARVVPPSQPHRQTTGRGWPMTIRRAAGF